MAFFLAAHFEKDFYFGLGKMMQSEGTNFDPTALLIIQRMCVP
ncbi:hypothetical protein [Celerinatantimonas diazotrophica]|uniref:Uncharacterized protein n=1 Tax=Celerinatantimonas diazotrophica TaxID=412034 RepID=A0A4R1JA20_9GAMM|nr:hypothetical protein [Celerinatantimonas diazotrophica]TCK47448.1 hypothetical protein EV690_2472 [Celerinatantimonas diazotrophica]CAG9294933.1 hypothetical protein CEDIAZO_00039 [Celerinatantimonas diazotrophica]